MKFNTCAIIEPTGQTKSLFSVKTINSNKLTDRKRFFNNQLIFLTFSIVRDHFDHLYVSRLSNCVTSIDSFCDLLHLFVYQTIFAYHDFFVCHGCADVHRMNLCETDPLIDYVVFVDTDHENDYVNRSGDVLFYSNGNVTVIGTEVLVIFSKLHRRSVVTPLLSHSALRLYCDRKLHCDYLLVCHIDAVVLVV